MLLDEPAAFLDIDQQLNCFELLQRQAAAGVLCMAVSHDLNLALEFCSRLIVLSGRTIVCDLPMADAAEADRLAAVFLDAARAGGHIRRARAHLLPLTAHG